jgi:hypothetical protein
MNTYFYDSNDGKLLGRVLSEEEFSTRYPNGVPEMNVGHSVDSVVYVDGDDFWIVDENDVFAIELPEGVEAPQTLSEAQELATKLAEHEFAKGSA